MTTRRADSKSPKAPKSRARTQAKDKSPASGGKGPSHAGISNLAVRKATGRGWAAWFKVLNRIDVKACGHASAAEFLLEEHECSAWWSQMIVVGYEQAMGLRKVHQKSDGFSASVSRTIAVALPKVYKAWGENARAAWLPDPNVVVRTSRPNKSMRITWTDAKSRVEVNFHDKTGKDGARKSQVAIQHDRLANAAQVKKMKLYWSEALDALRGQLET